MQPDQTAKNILKHPPVDPEQFLADHYTDEKTAAKFLGVSTYWLQRARWSGAYPDLTYLKRNMSTLLRQIFFEFSVFAFRTLGDFDPLRVPQKALRAFRYSGNAHRMGAS